MAPASGLDYLIYVTPNTVSNLTATDSSSTITSWTIIGNYKAASSNLITTWTITADGYQSQQVTADGSGTDIYVTLVENAVVPTDIQTNLTTVSGTKDAIKQAIINKGVSVSSSDTFASYATKISNIETLNGETRTITPTTSSQTITPSSGKNAITSVTVQAVTSGIDSDIVAGNIKSGVNILGVDGSVIELNGQTKTLTADANTLTTTTISPDSSHNALTSATVDLTYYENRLSALNGTAIANDLVSKTINSNGTYYASSDSAYGYSSVIVNVAGIPREVSSQGVYQMPSTNFTFSLPSNATDLGNYALSYAFAQSASAQNCKILSLDLSSLETISGGYALQYVCYMCRHLTSVDFSNLEVISGTYALHEAFDLCTALASVSLPNLTTISGSLCMQYSFKQTGLTNINFPSLITVSGNRALDGTFNSCSHLLTANFPSLTTVSGDRALEDTLGFCQQLTSVDFSNLEVIGLNVSNNNSSHFRRCFRDCTLLTSISFPKLTTIYCTDSSASSGTFYDNNTIQKMYFPKLTTITYGTGASTSYQEACKNIFSGCSSLTELHFGASNQSAIEASPGYSTAWGRGAGNVTIYFDL